MLWLWVLVCVALGVGLYMLFWQVYFGIRIRRMKRWVKSQER